MNTPTTQNRIATAVRRLPKLAPVGNTLITIRRTTLPEPRKLMAAECRECGPRSGFSVRIGGQEGFRSIKMLAGTVRLHVGDRNLASAAAIMARIGGAK